MYKKVFRFDKDYMMRLGLLFVRYTKLVMVVMCLSVSLSLAVLVTGNGEDIGVLADLQPVEHHQESLHAGPNDGVSAELPPLWQLHSSSQPVLHSTSQPVLHSTSQPVQHLSSLSVLQSTTSTREVTDKNDDTVKLKAVEAEVTTSGPSQVIHYKPQRPDSQTNLFGTTDVKSPVLKSLNGQSDDFGNTRTGKTEQSQSFLEVSKNFGESGSMGNQYRHSDDDTGLVKQHRDSVARPIVQNPVETALDRSLKTEEKSRNSTVDKSTVMDKWILQEFQHQDNTFKYNINENEEDSNSFGNPPILLDMDDQNSEEKSSLDLSSDEGGEPQTESADKLDMTATHPNLTLLPLEQNFQMLPSEKTSTPSTNAISSTSTPESVTLSNDKESSMLNMINDLIKIESGEDTQNSVGNAEKNFPDSMNGFKVVENKYVNEENHGRRVLNEESIMKKASGQADDDYDLKLNMDDYFYQYYDEEEDDYVGGEVLATVSSKAEPAELNVDQAENGVKTEVEMMKDNVVDIDGQKENGEASREQKGNSGEFNLDRIFSYEVDDDDWYYDPEAKERGQLIKTSTTTSIDISLQAKSGITNASLSESRVAGGGGKAEGVISGEEPHKKVLQAPKGTIILYTAVIVILIACFVLFSVWKNGLPAGRPTHLPTHVRSGEEGKRLVDHPFV